MASRHGWQLPCSRFSWAGTTFENGRLVERPDDTTTEEAANPGPGTAVIDDYLTGPYSSRSTGIDNCFLKRR
jgi:hypothetical protein